MKNKFKWIGIAILSAVLIFGITGCGEPDKPKPKKNKDAFLSDIFFGSKDVDTVSATLATEVALDSATGAVPNGSMGSIILLAADDWNKALTMTISPRAKAVAIRSTGNNFPGDAAWESGIESGSSFDSANIAANSRIFVMVTSEDESNVNIYAFTIAARSSVAEINRVSIGDITGTYGAGGETTAAAAAAAGIISLPSTVTTGTFSAVHSNANVMEHLEIMYAKTANAAAAAPTDFSATAPTTFAHGEVIYIRVRSENRLVTKYYVVNVEVGSSAALASFSIHGVALGLSGTDANVVGTPAATIAGITVEGNFEPGFRQPAAGFTPITATTVDSGATVTWAKGTIAVPPTTFGTDATIQFAEGEYLFIRVVSQNTTNTLFYRLEVVLEQFMAIFYGSPNLRDPAGTDTSYIDPMWTDVTMGIVPFNVSRVNLNEMVPQDWYFATGAGGATQATGHTTATGRALWDDSGMYFYVDVNFHNFFRNGASVTRTLYSGTAHECDSVEVFTNERYQHTSQLISDWRAASTANTGRPPESLRNFGVQLRLGPQSRESTAAIAIANPYGFRSGDQANTAGGFLNVLSLYEASTFTDFASFVKPNNAGYAVFIKAPWGGKNAATANQLFDPDTGLVRTHATDDMAGPSMGMELQLNTRNTGGTGSRDSILTWNGIHDQAYRNNTSFGIVELVFGSATARADRVIDVADPRITTQPSDRNYVLAEVQGIGEIPQLTVVAATDFPTVHALTYRWFVTQSATLESPFDTDGTTLAAGVTELSTVAATHRPGTEITAAGEYYYWVQVVNTRATASVTPNFKTLLSRRAVVDVDPIERPRITAHPASGFYLVGSTPANRTVTVPALGEGHGTLSYQWWSSTVDADDLGAAIAGETEATLTFTQQDAESVTWYWVVVTNTLGTETIDVTSNKARISIVTVMPNLVAYDLATAGTMGTGGGFILLEGGNGFEFNRTATGWANDVYLRFRIDFGEEATRRLPNYSGIRFTYTPISGDTNHKDLRFSTNDTAFTGGIANDTNNRVLGMLATGAIIDGTSYNYTINFTNAARVTAMAEVRNPRFAFNMGTNAIRYRITNLVFIGADGAADLPIFFPEPTP